MKNKTLLPGALALAAAFGALQFSDGKGLSLLYGEAHAQNANIIATVNDVAIPQSRVDLYIGTQQISATDRENVIQNIITSELILQAAREKGLADDARVQDELAIAEYTIVGRAYVEDFFDGKAVDDARILARYEEISKQAIEDGEYDVAHILVGDEALANDLMRQLKEDPDRFAELASAHSQDPGSQPKGGRLDWIAPQALVVEFAEAMKSLDEGEMVDAPVRTQFGWHIIRVDGKRDASAPPLTGELRQRIEQLERAELFNEHIESLRESAKVKLN